MKNIRVRFAPSPTGYLHVGGARTAIFNWLFARKHRGQFLLRIEDTDVARSGDEMVEAIIKGMQWLGLNWDEEIVYQSARLEVYQAQAAQLIADGKGYKCFCSKEELEARRQKTAKEKRDYKYKHERTCLNRKTEEIEAFEKEGRPFVVRFKLPEGETVFSDQVYGEIRVNHAQLDDFIIQRSDGYPTYHLAVVVDDHEMAISHIIRGDDHLSNTPKHVLLFQAFGWTCPIFAHVPLILGADKHRLSKRHGATAVGEYEKSGYLAEAFLNFLSLLGWSSGDDRELFSREELIQEFDLSGIQKKSAVFDEKKLEWLNGQYLMALDDRKLLELVSPSLLKAGLVTDDTLSRDKEYVLKIIALLKPRLKRLSEISDLSRYFFRDPETYAEKAVKKHWSSPDVIEQLTSLKDQLEGVSDFNTAGIEPVIRGLAEELNKGAGKIIHPLRLALTGVSFSPGIFEVMELLGKETVMNRLKTAIHFLESHAIEPAEA
ncbi:glutamate--tRNA ligase [candidate division KSB1 bacterium]|nr:glutamate--tRNA ligase [candidate division KSB1 bacterium]